MTSDLKTTTQLVFCDRSMSKLANCGMETLGSLVQCNKSEKKIKITKIDKSKNLKIAIITDELSNPTLT